MPSISFAKLQQLELAQKELKELQLQKMIKPFVEAFTNNLGTLAAYTPINKWPKEFKACFDAVARTMQTAAEIYKDRLPIE